MYKKQVNTHSRHRFARMLLILCFITVILLLLYIKFKYFTLRGPIPGLPPQFLVGNFLQIGFTRGASFTEAYCSLNKRFGDVYQIWFAQVRCIVLCNAQDIQHVFTNRNIYDQGALLTEKMSLVIPNALVSTKGAKFKRHGAVSMPIFRRAKVVPNFDLVIDWTDKLLDKWRAQPKDCIHTDIIQQCQNLTLQLFGFIGFDFDLDTMNDGHQKNSRNELTQALGYVSAMLNVAFFTPKVFAKIYLTLNPRYRRARAIIEKYIYQMIDQELAQSEESRAQRKRTSLIASLVGSIQHDEKLEESKREEDKRGLSRAEILDEMISFLMAGFETTSTTLSWFVFAMSKHPRVQQKLKTEVKGEDGRLDLSVERLDSLTYLDCVINEIFRFYSPTSGTTRAVTTDDRLPASGVQLYAGEQVVLASCVAAMNPQLWSIDPERFYPERFLAEDKTHHPYAFFPFGGGHRQCIGQDLARFELKVIIARLMQYVTFGDGGPELNAGGKSLQAISQPKKVGVTITFD